MNNAGTGGEGVAEAARLAIEWFLLICVAPAGAAFGICFVAWLVLRLWDKRVRKKEALKRALAYQALAARLAAKAPLRVEEVIERPSTNG